MNQHLSTGQVARLLRVAPHRLGYLTRDQQLRPTKGPTGAFLWTTADVTRAATLLGIDPDERRSEPAALAPSSPAAPIRDAAGENDTFDAVGDDPARQRQSNAAATAGGVRQ